jgi:hypothetical protein
MFRIANTMAETLERLRAHAEGRTAMGQDPAAPVARKRLDDAVELSRWQDVEKAFGTGERV